MGSDNGHYGAPLSSRPSMAIVWLYLFGGVSVLMRAHRTWTSTSTTTSSHSHIIDSSAALAIRRNSVIKQPSLSTPIVSPSSTKSTTSKAKLKDGIFPKSCTEAEMTITKNQLPSFRCLKTKDRPWSNHCSFSYATQCPDPQWFKEQFATDLSSSAESGSSSRSNLSTETSLSAILVGCSTMNSVAVNTLRLLTGNSKYDPSAHPLQTASTTAQTSRCPELPHSLDHDAAAAATTATSNKKAVLYCIESTKNSTLEQRVKDLGWDQQLKVQKLRENGSLDATVVDIASAMAKEEESMMLTTIHYLRLSPETNVFDTVLDGTKTLARTQYLEFEYNWKEPWKRKTLSETVKLLKNSNFVCYWSGHHGNIWRITDCFHEHYDIQFWSNVACVNVITAAPLADRMEDMAKATLGKEYSLKYQNENFIKTDGSYPQKDKV